MAALSAVTGNADSEYGSDFDTDGEVELANLLESLTRPDDIKTHPEVKQYVLEDIEQNDGASSARNVAPLHIPHNDALAGVFVSDEALALELQIEDSQRRKHLQSVEVEYAEGSRQAWNSTLSAPCHPLLVSVNELTADSTARSPTPVRRAKRQRRRSTSYRAAVASSGPA